MPNSIQTTEIKTTEKQTSEKKTEQKQTEEKQTEEKQIAEKKEPTRMSAAQKRKLANRNRAVTRAVIQAVFFLSMPGAFVAGFNGIKYIFRQVAVGGVLERNSFVTVLIGLTIFTIVFGRFFCGYVCSFGALGDLVYWLSGLFQKKVLKRRRQISIPVKLIPYLQKLKYLNLAFILAMTALGWIGALKGTSAWDVFSQLTALRLPDWSFRIGILSMILILIGMCIQSRFFCQFLCPMGAYFAILPVLPFMPLRRSPLNCLKGCSACRRTCPVDLKLEPDGFRNGECISCERCVGVCPKDNLGYSASIIFKREIFYVLFRAAVFFAVGVYTGCCRFF